mgnify:CR=1 FL=1
MSMDPKQLNQGEEGSIFVEYVILMSMFGLIVAGAMLALGEPLLRFYHNIQLIWAGPFP